MKISYQEIRGENPYIQQKCIYSFEIVSDILKKHYKTLARMAMLFNSTKRNSGYIKKENAQEFLKLIAEIDSSSDKRCTASHDKAKATAAKRRNSSKCDHDDLGSLGYKHGETIICPFCGQMVEVW